MLSAKQLLKKNGENIFAWAKDRFINYLTNWEWIRISVNGQIRFEYATRGRGKFGIRKEKFADSKRLSGCVWVGPKTIAFLMLSCQRRRRCGTKNSLFGSGTRFVYVVVNFLFQLIFIFQLFWGMVMYANEFKTKEKQKLTEIKN